MRNAYSLLLFRRAILTREVGQSTDLVFGVRSGFFGKSCVHARFQISVCSGYRVCVCAILVNIRTHTDISLLSSLYE